ncbi:hypothetical protein O3P69_016984 [Scylla paramamosain]|uniref:Uncharacterized protein n=1 Tax=Scylla paramamosain TaxID=85552 RepID=A0AAW0TXW8_SCYPA
MCFSNRKGGGRASADLPQTLPLAPEEQMASLTSTFVPEVLLLLAPRLASSRDLARLRQALPRLWRERRIECVF